MTNNMSSNEAQQAQMPSLPTLHHLSDSQSQRILWLLEELSIEYNLVLHMRDKKKKRAPPELTKIHPLGKAPILVTTDGRTIIESSAIVTYLLRTYDPSGRFASPDWIRDEVLTSFAGASLGPWNALEMLFDLAAKHTPWPLSCIAKGIRGAMDKNIIGPEFTKAMDYLEGELGDLEWFNGKELGRADVMLSWPLDMMAQRGWVHFEKEYPKIAAWRQRILERDAWKRGIEKGNSYDLNDA